MSATALASAMGLNAQTLTNDLIFHAPFSGSLNDIVGGRVGNGTNSPTLQASGGVGGGGYVQLQNDSANPKQAVWYNDPTPTTNDFSFQIWVRCADALTAQNNQPDGDAAFAATKDWDSGANVGWVLAKQTDPDGDQFQWNMNTVGGTRKDLDLRSPKASVFDGTWHQLLVTYQRNGSATFYRDGATIATVNISGNNGQDIRPALNDWVTANILALGEDATLQYDHGTGSALNGDIDEAAMWQRVLTAEEVGAAYRKGVEGKGFGDAVTPVVIEQPQGGTRYANDSFTLSCTVADDRGPVTYQWYKDGAQIPSAASRTVLLNDLKAGVANYTAVASDGVGSVTSAPAVLTVLSTANITNGIAYYLPFDNNLNGQAGLPITGTPIGNTGTPRYTAGTIGSAADFQNDGNDGSPSDWAVSLGDIEWVYTNNWSFSVWVKTTDTSDGATFGNKDWNSGGNVGWVLAASRPDISRSLNFTCNGGPRRDIGGADIHNGAWHHVAAVFNRDLNTTYYYVDGTLTSSTGLGENGWQSLTPSNLNPNDTLVGSSGNGRWSGAATIDDLGMWQRTLTADEILAIYASGVSGNPLTKAVAGSAVKPAIISQPQSLTQLESYPATFTVSASGTKPLSYQWSKGTAPLTGETNATLSLPSVTASDEGSYAVRVANQFGSVTSAPPVTLTVVPLSAQLTNSLVVYLNFDNNIQGQAGTVISGTPIGTVGVEKYTNGLIGSAAARFDNDDSDSSRASDWAVSLGDIEWIYTNNWSFSVWVKTKDNYGALLGNKSWYSGLNIGWCISEYYTDWLNYTAEASSRHDIGKFNWADDKWHQVAAVFYRDGNRVYTFVDGVVTDQATLSATGLESLTPPEIMTTLVGSSGDTSESAYGSVDDLGMWTRALSTKDVLAMYQSGLRGVPLPEATLGGPLMITVTASSTSLTLAYPAWAKDYTLEASPDLTPSSSAVHAPAAACWYASSSCEPSVNIAPIR